MMRRLLATLTVVAVGFALVARADDPAKAQVDPKAKAAAKDENTIDEKVARQEAAIKSEQLSRQFREFEAALLRLAQRMETSQKPEDREKAVILKKAIEVASTEGTETKFDKLIKLLKDKDSLNLQDLEKAKATNTDLAADLAKILAILMTDNRDAELREKIRELNEMLKRLNQVIRDQQTVRAWTDRNAMEKERLEREQRLVRENTQDLIGQGKPKPGENKEARGDAKPQGKQGDPKDGGKPGEAKNDTKEAKGDERNQEGKPGDKTGDKESKPGEAKEAGKPGDNKEGKPGDMKEAGKAGDPKEGKPSDSKDSGKAGDPKEGKPGDSKDAGKPSQGGDPKQGKPGEAKSGGQPQSGSPKEGKPGEQKDAGKPEGAKENKPSEAKDAGKPGDNKDNKPAEAKDAGKENKDPGQQQASSKKEGQPADSKGKEENKADSKGQQAQSGSPQQGQPSQSQAKGQGQPQQGQPQQGGAKGDPQQQNQQNQQQQANNDNPAKKQIQEGVEAQKGAEDELKKPNLPNAADKQADAIQKLQEAQKKLEELLKQLRQEEIERILAALQGRCEKMLAMQIEVRDGTVGVYKVLADVKPNEEKPRAEVQKSNQLSEKEEEIVGLANKAVDLLKSEGSAVAFPEVFTQIRDDMITVALRLRKTDVGLVTQAIENDIIETLKEMIEALKKARQENQQPPQPGQPGQPGKPGDQKLIELLHELKMIRSMQVRVNDRTKLYGKEYQGEQAPAPVQAVAGPEREKAEMIQKEMKNLAERQDKIFEVTNNIAKGKNK